MESKLFNKILLCFDGSTASYNALEVSENFAKKFKSSINALYVIPDFKGFLNAISKDERILFNDWIHKNLVNKQADNLENIKKDLSRKRIKFSYEIVAGLPYEEILKYIKRNQFNVIALGKGRFNKSNILGGTALKLLKNSDIPLIIVGNTLKSGIIKNVLLPTDIFKSSKKDVDFAREISEKLKSNVYLFNVIEVGDHKFPVEVVESMKGTSYHKLAEYINSQNLSKKFQPVVRAAKNAWIGINEYESNNDIDIMLLNTYGGTKIRTEHIGSIAEKVIENCQCPVIAIPGKM